MQKIRESIDNINFYLLMLVAFFTTYCFQG